MTVVPDYLKEPSLEGHKYGKLYWDKKAQMFGLIGEPVLLEFAKRIFPGARVSYKFGSESNYREYQTVMFHKSRREVSDLNWLLMRFPVEVVCDKILKQYRNEAIQQWNDRASGYDLKRTAPPSDFLGKLYPFQEAAVTFLTTNKRCLLGDGMGLGKTWEALGAVAASGKYPVLIACETQVQRQWQRVIGSLFDLPCKMEQSFFDSPFDLACRRGEALAPILRTRTPYKLPDTPFAIIHYGLLKDWKKQLLDRGWPTLIPDEVQSFRHQTSQKYSAFSLLSSQAENVWGLSGTPVYGYGAEMWAVMNIIDFHCLGSWESFSREWCTGYGEKIVEDPKALHGFLTREGFLLRRRATDDDVNIDLPPIIRKIQDVEQDEELYEQLMTAARQKARNYERKDIDRHFRWRLGGEIERETRQAAGLAKAPFVAEVIKSVIEAGERPLVFAWHHSVHDIFQERLKEYSPAVLTGRQTEKQKDDNLRRFVNGDTPMVLLSLRSTAGLDGLQHRGTMCINAELDWSPAIHSQCETRLGRIGVNEMIAEIPSLYCVARSGYDETMLDVLGLKAGQFVGIMGDEPESHEEEKQQEQRVKGRIRELVKKLNAEAEGIVLQP